MNYNKINVHKFTLILVFDTQKLFQKAGGEIMMTSNVL